MSDAAGFAAIPTTTLADVLGKSQVMHLRIRALWPSGRLAGPAFTVQCPPGDNLMLHAAIHRAAPGTVIVVDAGQDATYALAGGNVCAVAQRRGVAGFVLDGVVRDIGEIRESGFPVFGLGVVPIPGTKKVVTDGFDGPVSCGGVSVTAGDIVVADEDGIVVVPAADAERVLAAAQAKIAKEDGETLDEWEAAHDAKINEILRAGGFEG